MSELDLGLSLLDHQLIDREGRNCGNADDLELDLEEPGGPRVAAILTGPQAWRARGRIARAAASLFPHGGFVRIRWEDVEKVDASIHLRRRAHELGLGEGDRVLGGLVERLPGGRL